MYVVIYIPVDFLMNHIYTESVPHKNTKSGENYEENINLIIMHHTYSNITTALPILCQNRK